MISCLIPAYNEEKNIKNTINSLNKINIEKEIIVINDGSTDKTAEIASKEKIDLLINLNKNVGKAGAVSCAIPLTKFKYILLTDADLLGINDEILNLIYPVLKNEAEMTIASNIPFTIKFFSGLRCIKKDVFFLEKNFLEKIKKSKYNLENELNNLAKLYKLRVKYVPMKKIRNTHKIKKYGMIKGTMKTLEMYYQLTYYILKNKIN